MKKKTGCNGLVIQGGQADLLEYKTRRRVNEKLSFGTSIDNRFIG